MFCIKCGKPAKIGNFCRECFVESHSLFNAEDLKMGFCGICGINEDEIITKIEKSIKSNNIITHKKISLRIIGNRAYATVICNGKISGVKKTETKKMLVMLRKKMCDMHVKLSGGYYEAMMQIRGPNKEDILKQARHLLPKKSISNIEVLNEGYNIKVMRKANAAAAAKGLRKKFFVKDSYKLVGNKKGQNLYRNFYAVR